MMVARKLDEDALIDLYLLYHDVNKDFTIEYLANKVGISRSRLGKLFKRVNPDLTSDYGNDRFYKKIFNEHKDTNISVGKLAQKYGVSRSTLYRYFRIFNNEK